MYSEVGEAAGTFLNVCPLNGQRETANTSIWTDNCPMQIQTG